MLRSVPNDDETVLISDVTNMALRTAILLALTVNTCCRVVDIDQLSEQSRVDNVWSRWDALSQHIKKSK